MSTTRNILLAASLGLLCAGQSFAQTAPEQPRQEPTPVTQKKYTVSGTAIDAQTRKPLSYATVSLTTDSTQTPVAAVVTGNEGRFSLPVKAAGHYHLHLSFTGYTATTQDIAVSEETPTLQLGELSITPGLTTDEVTVTAQRPLVTADIDKITYNTSADPETPTLTALEMMRKVPMLTVDGDDNLLLKGQGNFKILVNGKTSTLMARNYKDVLKAMPANSIKSIEVITDPPAKYDAEGIGGIINIITNRKSIGGFNGSLGIGTNTWGGVNGNAYIAASLGKFSLSANYFGNYSRSPESTSNGQTENFDNPDAHYLNYHTASKNTYSGNGFNLEAGYEIDTFNLISIALNGYLGGYESKGERRDETYTANLDPAISFLTHTTNQSNYGSVSGNIDYQRTYLKPDKTFTASYKFDYSPDHSKYDRSIEGLLNYPTYDQRSENNATGYEHTFQADYFNPITKKHQIEAGAKYILRPNNSDPETYRREPGGEWQKEENRQNSLDYRQHIAAAYASYLLKLSEFSFKLGARAEYTINDGTFHLTDGDHKLNNKYFDLIPYVTFGWQPTQQQNVRLGYTQRLSRPGIWYLNPYVNDADPLNISTGNPRLKSQVSHSFNLSYSNFGPKYNISVSLNANLTNKAINQVTTTMPNGGLFSTYENIGKRQYYGASFYGSLRLLDNKLSFSLNAGGGYTLLDARSGSGLKNEGWNSYAMLNINTQPWKNGNIYVGGGLWSSYIGLQSKGSMGGYHSIGISHGFLDKKLSLSISASNPFQSRHIYKNQEFGPDYYRWGRSSMPYRSFRINLTWRFGKVQAQVKKARRGIRNDDLQSGGNSSQSGGGQGQ